MRRDLVIALTGALAIVIVSAGLVTGALREGPHDRDLEPAPRFTSHFGSYDATAGDEPVQGVCLEPPCTPRTRLDLTIGGLPDLPYDGYLVGPTGESDLIIPDLTAMTLTFRYNDAVDHTDKERFELRYADTTVFQVPLERDLGGNTEAVWPTLTGRVHMNEIGGVSVSTVAKATIDQAPPEGYRYHAWFVATDDDLSTPDEWVDLGTFDENSDGTELDGRVERVRLEEQDRFMVYLAPHDEPDQTPPYGFPVLRARI